MKQKKSISNTKIQQAETSSGNTIAIRIILAVIVLVLYVKSTGFEFTLDDDIFYVKHESVQKGISATGEFFAYGSMYKFDGTTGLQPYRPLALLSFAIDKELSDNSPARAHLINVILYILLLQVLLSLLIKLFPDIHKTILGFMVILFAVHPIHTEVICSVKSRDELLAALFAFISWYKFLPKQKGELIRKKNAVFGILFFMMALLSKESAIAFALVIPLSYFMFYKNDVKKSLITFGLLSIGAVVFLFMRQTAFNNSTGIPHTMQIPLLDNVLAGNNTFAQATATRMEILFYNLKLLFVPWPLSWDYSFNQIPLVDWSNILPWAGLISYSLLFIIAIVQFRKKPILSFSILFFFITSSPTNNLFFLNGATIAERFLFVPSLAFAFFVTNFLATTFKINTTTFTGNKKKIFSAALIFIMIISAGLSNARCPDWKDNFSLFESGAKNAPKSSRTNAALASEYMNKAEKESDVVLRKEYVDSSISFYKKSLAIFPMNSDASYKVGLIYSMYNDTTQAIKYYKLSLDATPQQIYALNNLACIYSNQKNYDSAIYYFGRSYVADSTNEMTTTNLVISNFSKGNDDQVIYFGNRTLELNAKNKTVLEILAKSWERKGNAAMVEKYLQMTKDLQSNINPSYLNK